MSWYEKLLRYCITSRQVVRDHRRDVRLGIYNPYRLEKVRKQYHAPRYCRTSK